MATGFCRWELLQVPSRVRSMLRCLCSPSVVDQAPTEPSSIQHLPEMQPSISKLEDAWQEQEPPQQKAAVAGISAGSPNDSMHTTGDKRAPMPAAHMASNCSAGSAAYVVELSSSTTTSSSSSSSYTGASSDMLAGSSSPPSVCSSAGHPQATPVALSRIWRRFDSAASDACHRSCSFDSTVAVVSRPQPEKQHQQQQQQFHMQQPRSLYAASGGNYARLLQLRQLEAQPHALIAGSASGRAAAALTHSASSPCLAYSNSIGRSSTAETSSQHGAASVADYTAAALLQRQSDPLQQQQQQQQQHQATRPLTRTCSWPWLSGSSSRSSRSPDRTTAAAGSSRRLLSEGGLAAVAGAAGLHPAVQAYLQGSLGIAFSGGGFRFTYFVGVMDVLLHHLGLVSPSTLLSGASSGALIAVFTKCGLPVERVMQLTDKLSQECSTQGLKGRLGTLLRVHLEANLPDDAHVTCHGNTFMAVTQVWPAIRTRLFSSFPTRTDLINAMMASCHLPTLSDGSFTVNFNGRLHIDGGLLSVLTPPPGAAHTVHVCSMPSRQIAKLPAFISRPQQSDISISPDTFQTWPFTRSQTTGLALQPPSPEFIEHMVARGRADAMAWAESVGFTHDGLPVFPTATKLEKLRREIFGTGLPSVQPATTETVAEPVAVGGAVLGEALAGVLHSSSTASQPAWESFFSRALQEGMLQQKQLQQQGLHCDTSQALAAEAATAPAAAAAAEDAAAVAAEVGRALSPTARSGLRAIKSVSVPAVDAPLASSSNNRVHGSWHAIESTASGPLPAVAAFEAAGFGALTGNAAAATESVGPQSVSGSSDGQAGSSGDWQFLVAELGINTNAEVQELAAAAAGGSY